MAIAWLKGLKVAKEKTMKTRIILTVLLVLVYFVGMSLYNMMQGPIEAAAAVDQLSDGAVQYGTSRAMATGLIPKVASLFLGLLLLVVWLPAIFRMGNVRNTTSLVFIAVAGIALVGCRGPYQVEVVEEIAPNETAKRWKGDMPSSILPQGSNLLFGLDRPTSPPK